MLLNVAPSSASASSGSSSCNDIVDLVDEDEKENTKKNKSAVAVAVGGVSGFFSSLTSSSSSSSNKENVGDDMNGNATTNNNDTDADTPTKRKKKKKNKDEIRKHIPIGYEDNYVLAYRRCQDKPGGPMLNGLPEARYEAYARAYAGCGTHILNNDYKRSYARLYESVVCATHGSESKYTQLFEKRPWDLIGRTCRLEPLEKERHLHKFYEVTCGEACGEERCYDSNLIWSFLDYGPFKSVEEMGKSKLFIQVEGEASFAIIESITDKLLGVVSLYNDDPKNLKICLDNVIVKPTAQNTVEVVESCFLLLDRLFANGYRRVQMSIDSQDSNGRKMINNLGFTQEGVVLKDLIVKDANRDSCIYGMLNSDWNKGARAYLFKKLHGAKYQKLDDWNNAKERELEYQMEQLKKKEEQETKQEKEQEQEGEKENEKQTTKEGNDNNDDDDTK